jgi:three-Cys-motif partner protein
VVFLDPYALQVDWMTLEALASTQVLDVWYLFPIRDTIRQLAHNFEGIGPKEPMLDRLLGPEWRELYSIVPEMGGRRDLFDEPAEPEMRRVVSVRQFEQWLKGRLEGEFRFVSQPLPILTTPSRQAFSLFLGVSNPSEGSLFAMLTSILPLGHLVERPAAKLQAGSLFVLSAALLKKERCPVGTT